MATIARMSFFGTSTSAPHLAALLSQPQNQLPSFHATDSVLVVAPHPDDECIANAGAILDAVRAGASVHIVYLTYGDNFEISYWAAKKVPAFTPSQFKALGELRHSEAISGATSLGLAPTCLTFLGYPDSGTLRIWDTTWKPGTSRLHIPLDSRSVPYADALTPGSPYNAGAVITDLEKVMKACSPTVILFPSPLDLNPDHQSAYLFVTAALHDLNLHPSRYTYLVHEHHFPVPHLYNPLATLTPPAFVTSLPVGLRNLQLTAGQVALKYTTTMLYHSQTKVDYRLLASFSRHNEVFFDDEHPLLSSTPTPFSHIPLEFLLEHIDKNVELRAVGATRKDPQTLRLSMTFAAPPTVDSVAEISVFPMTPGAPFAQEPKLVISLQHGKEARTVDLVTETSVATSVTTTLNGADVTLDIAIPEVATATEIMLNVRAGYRGLPQYSTPWQVFSLASP
ncbi:PIG-L family deacetylase [bacterium]|nr:PIG-L family deacetylase [bacterium]